MPQLLYTQVVKTTRRRLVRVRHRVVFGTLAAVEQVLATHGGPINTTFVERLHLSIRQHVAAVGRRVTTLHKHEEGLRQQLAAYTSDDRGPDQSCVDIARSVAVSRTPVAVARGGVRRKWSGKQPSGVA